jgi:uncharacterized protein with HEPN domain
MKSLRSWNVVVQPSTMMLCFARRERCLEIIGEAAKSVSPSVTEAHPEIPWSDLAKVRDRLSLHYHRVDQGQLWTIASVDMASTAVNVRSLAAQL